MLLKPIIPEKDHLVSLNYMKNESKKCDRNKSPSVKELTNWMVCPKIMPDILTLNQRVTRAKYSDPTKQIKATKMERRREEILLFIIVELLARIIFFPVDIDILYFICVSIFFVTINVSHVSCMGASFSWVFFVEQWIEKKG